MSGAVKASVGAGLLLVGVFLVGSGLLVRSILPECFQATAKVSVDRPQAQTGAGAETSGAEIAFLKSNEVLGRVITNLHLQQRWAARFKEDTPLPVDVTCERVRSQVQVRQTRESAVLEISVVNADGREAAEIANEIARIYQETAMPGNRTVRLVARAETPVRPMLRFPWPCLVAVSLGGLLVIGGLVLLLTGLMHAGRPRPVAGN